MNTIQIKSVTLTYEVKGNDVHVLGRKGRGKIEDWQVLGAVQRATAEALADASPCHGADLLSIGMFSGDVSALCRTCNHRRELGAVNLKGVIHAA